MLKNEIILPGVTNSRELGGYPVGNKTVRKGVLLRTGALGNAEPEAVDLLSGTYHLQTAIDFRMSRETKKAPDPEIPGAKMVNLPVVDMEDYINMLGNPELAKRLWTEPLTKAETFDLAYENGLIGPEMYILFITGRRGIKAYKEFFRILLDTDPDKGAILWHCTDGKDRTGLAAAMLLAALGASRETIFEDFLLTNEYNAARVKAVWEKYLESDMEQERLEAILFTTGGVVERYLDRVFEVMEDRFGGMMGYLHTVLELTDRDLAKLCEKYIYSI